MSIRRSVNAMVAAGLASVLSLSQTHDALAAAVDKRPNVIFILIDDLRWDAMSCLGHPILKTPNMDRLRKEGVLFQNAFVTTSLCAPARASFLTGAYAHNHGVIGNWGCEFNSEAMPSFPLVLQGSGYETAFIGKWHMRFQANPRPGFDYWLSFKGQGVYTDPELNENGREFEQRGYITDILTDYAVKFINGQRDKPYCLYLSHKAVHSPFTPATRHTNDYANAELPVYPNSGDTFAGKPAWLRGGIADPRLGQKAKDVPESLPPNPWDPTEKRRRDYLKTVNAVDDSVGRILKVLEQKGELDNTVVMFSSDNGFFHGEHGRGDKRLMYEESIRIPMLMRYPPLAKAGSTVEQMVLNIDVAPTLLAAAGVSTPPTMQGRSALPLLAGNTDGWRKSFLYEYWLDLTPRLPNMLGVRTDDWKLIRYPQINDMDEMYDLKNDPHEMTNLALDPRHVEKHKQLSKELERLLKATGYGSKPIPEPRILRKKRVKDKNEKKQ